MIPVHITGMGAISPLGNSVKDMFDGLIEHKTAIQMMPDWAKYRGLLTQIAAPVPKYDIMKVPRSARRTMSRMSEMATLATVEAMAQARVPHDMNHARSLMAMGCSTGSPSTFEEYFVKMIERGGPEGQMGTSFFKVMNHTVPTNVASAIGFNGAVISPSCACATSAQSIILGWELIQAGLYDMVIAGGADELHYTSAAVFDVVFAASRGFNDRPLQASRPFDRDRDGLVVAEGAGVVVLESEESLKRRGAVSLARLEGGAYLCSGSHMSQSSAGVMKDVMKMALDRAKAPAASVDYINAHATATRQGDQEEAESISSLFGAQVPVSSLKGHLGHTLAACGALETIASVRMMQESILIPTRNLENVDPACAQIQHLQERRSTKINRVLSNNFAFGGLNTCLILSRDHA